MKIIMLRFFIYQTLCRNTAGEQKFCKILPLMQFYSLIAHLKSSIADFSRSPYFLFIFFINFSLYSTAPYWLEKIPYSDEFFYGIGSGYTEEDAESVAKSLILMQLSSHVESGVSITECSDAVSEETVSSMKIFINTNSLRGARVIDRYYKESVNWVLMEYPGECGKQLIFSSIERFIDDNNDIESIMKNTESEKVKKSIRMKLNLHEAVPYNPNNKENIGIKLNDNEIIMTVYEFGKEKHTFLEYIKRFAEKLAGELKSMDYQTVNITGYGYAHYDSSKNKDAFISHQAKLIGFYLKNRGINIDQTVRFDNTETDRISGGNRRIEITINLK